MFAIDKFSTETLGLGFSLKTLENKVIKYSKGQRVNLLAIKAVDSVRYFAIQTAEGVSVLPYHLFADFKLFKKEMTNA